MQMFLDQAKTYASGSSIGVPTDPTKPENPKKMDWVYEEINDSIAPRVIVKYGPNSRYPRVACCAIAAAQALSYFETPDKIYLSEENRWLDLNWYAFKHLDEPIAMYELGNCYSFMNELAIRMNADSQTGATDISDCNNVLKSLLPDKVGNLTSGRPDPHHLIKDSGNHRYIRPTI